MAAYNSIQGIPNAQCYEDELNGVKAPASTFTTIDLSDDDEMYEKIQQLENPTVDDVKSKPSVHEIPLEKIEIGPIPKYIPPETQILPVAVVHHFSGSFSIADSIGKAVAPGSLLADENRNPITRVIDLFGPVESPKLILKGQIPVGTELYAVIGDAEFPDPDLIEKQFPGTDASNRFDEASSSVEFSDDEEERNYKRMKKQNAKKLLTDPCDEMDYNDNIRDYEQ